MGAAEPKALWPGIVGILHEDSNSKGKDAQQTSACSKERESWMVFVLTADI